jgi:apolipoprotein N-acyltransferase
LFLALTRWAHFRLRVPLIVAAPIIWVAVEYMRAYFLTGFPWYYLAHSQFRYLNVIQIADITGSLGVSLLIAIVNAWVVDLMTLPLLRPTSGGSRLTSRQAIRVWLVTILLGTTLCYGAFRRSTARFQNGPRLALLQSNLPQQQKERREAPEIMERFGRLIDRALSSPQRPDLIVWPETSYAYRYIEIDPGIPRETLEAQVRSISPKINVQDWLQSPPDIVHDLHGRTDFAGVPMLIGTPYYHHRPGKVDKYNSALLFEPGAPTIQIYHKIHLVPFGEFIPLVETLPWLKLLTPYRDKIPSLSFGTEAVKMTLGTYRLAVTICFEDTIPQVINLFFQDESHQPDVLLNISNDGWYPNSSELDMHLAIGVFRAIEHRVPLARAVNTGLTALIDGNGDIVATLPKSVEDVLPVTVPLDGRTSSYSRWGDWLGLSCLAVTIGLVPLGLLRRFQRAPVAT